MLAQLDAGKNVLLYNLSLYLPAYQTFQRLLASEPGFGRHVIKPIFIIGRPLVVYEQRWRLAGKIAENNQLAHARVYSGLSSLIEYIGQSHGKQNMTLLADMAVNPKSLPQKDLTSRIFASFNCPAPDIIPETPDHTLIFGSFTARQILNARKARFNAWPPLDDGLYIKHLLNLDQNWDNRPLSPLKLRKLLYMEGKTSREKLETMLALSPSSLEAPAWLLEEPEIAQPAQLDIEKTQEFANSLPIELGRPLAKRLRNDKPILTYPQQCLLDALKDRPENEFKFIGEPEQPIELTVLTMTYNQEKFIGQCMDSVLAQQAPFPVRHIVLDHCSNDATPRIIAEYAAKNPSIFPVLLDRHKMGENVAGLFQRCKTRFAALCDGDDYFLDPQKLRKQVDFLETHPKCALVSHPVKVIYENSDKDPTYFPAFNLLPRGLKEEYYLSDLFLKNFLQTNSVVYRWRFADGLPSWFRADICPGDWYWHLLHAENGKIGFIPEAMSVYRRHVNAHYVNSIANPTEHHKKTGMAELETYKVVDDHFEGRFFNRVSNLASSVFGYFLLIARQEKDDSLLKMALEKYPKFGKSFLGKIKMEMEEKTKI